MPSVSVIVTTYNRANYIKEAIDSVLSQTFRDWELIVVDDGSTDGTSEILHTFSELDKRICWMRQPNAGSAASRNAALARARGNYISFLDDDDRWLPEKLETQVAFMESHPEIGFSYTRFQIFKKIENRLEHGKLFPEFLATKFEELPDAFIAPCTVLLRKSCLDEIGWFDLKYSVSEDFDLWLRFAQRWKIAPIDKVYAMTVMDDRNHEGKDQLTVNEATSDVLRNLELMPQYQHCKPLIRRQIAMRMYGSGRILFDRGAYWPAAKYFAIAVFTDPLVGLAVRRPGQRGLVLALRVLKSYAAVPMCLLKGFLHAGR